ncbi:hypothetical protein [Streptomyces sp. NPDC050264]|uniref:hypothetical protein n=1 Tax=Streptomyces sp. NPDC050264 TaxID=3155038 RepID=UPI003446785B
MSAEVEKGHSVHEDPAWDEADFTMTAAIRGVLREHPWIGQVIADMIWTRTCSASR